MHLNLHSHVANAVRLQIFIIATPVKGLNFNMEGDDDDLESSLARAFLTVDLLQER